MGRPTPDPSQEGSRCPCAPRQFPSWEGLGMGSWSQHTVARPRRLSMVIRHSSFDNLCETVQVSMHGIKVIEAFRERHSSWP